MVFLEKIESAAAMAFPPVSVEMVHRQRKTDRFCNGDSVLCLLVFDVPASRQRLSAWLSFRQTFSLSPVRHTTSVLSTAP
jgi:hypothetical protein